VSRVAATRSVGNGARCCQKDRAAQRCQPGGCKCPPEEVSSRRCALQL
jgi:hypothetical protein